MHLENENNISVFNILFYLSLISNSSCDAFLTGYKKDFIHHLTVIEET
jgi:hypothetical protein